MPNAILEQVQDVNKNFIKNEIFIKFFLALNLQFSVFDVRLKGPLFFPGMVRIGDCFE